MGENMRQMEIELVLRYAGSPPHPAQNQLARENFLAHHNLIQSSGEKYHWM